MHPRSGTPRASHDADCRSSVTGVDVSRSPLGDRVAPHSRDGFSGVLKPVELFDTRVASTTTVTVGVGATRGEFVDRFASKAADDFRTCECSEAGSSPYSMPGLPHHSWC